MSKRFSTSAKLISISAPFAEGNLAATDNSILSEPFQSNALIVHDASFEEIVERVASHHSDIQTSAVRVSKAPLPPLPGLHTTIANLVCVLLAATWCSLSWCASIIWRYIRHHPSHAVFNVFIVFVFGLLALTGERFREQLLLSQIPDVTVDELIRASSYRREFVSPELSGKGSDEFLGVGAPPWAQREAIRAILYYARRGGLSLTDQAVLLAIAEVESGFNPMARAPTTSACDLFQFVKGTAALYGLSQEQCMNPWINAQAGIAHYRDNYQRGVESRVANLRGIEKLARTFEFSYYLHHDGPNSSNPAAEVKSVVLGGMPFLFRAHIALEKEFNSAEQVPTFLESVWRTFYELLDSIRSRFSVKNKLAAG